MPDDEIARDLLAAIRASVSPGEELPTLGLGNPNLIGAIRPDGVEVTTEHSETPLLVPAWMFNEVWQRLLGEDTLRRDDVDKGVGGRAVKRSSIVFAILERTPGVEVVDSRPLTLKWTPEAKSTTGNREGQRI